MSPARLSMIVALVAKMDNTWQEQLASTVLQGVLHVLVTTPVIVAKMASILQLRVYVLFVLQAARSVKTRLPVLYVPLLMF